MWARNENGAKAIKAKTKSEEFRKRIAALQMYGIVYTTDRKEGMG